MKKTTPVRMRRKNVCRPWHVATLLLLLIAFSGQTAAEEQSAETQNRIEASGSFEYLSPHDAYGDWETVTAAFYRKERTDLTWFTELDAFRRKEGRGFLGMVGAYKDWTDVMYTYSALSSGTSSDYLPRIRADHAFNIKFGPEKKFVWLIGGTWISYFTPHREMILSTGLTAYLDRWIPEYRIFRNVSSPGAVESYSHLLSLAYGQEKHQWTTIVAGYGKQAYQAVELGTSSQISAKSLSLSLKHRMWLRDNYGIMAELSYLDLQGTYQKGGFLFGMFREF